MRSKSFLTTRDMTFMAMYLALFFVLDVMSNVIPLFKMPNGGSLGLGTIPLLICSYQMGWKKGTIVSLLSVLLQFLTGQMYVLGFVQMLLDYIIAFGCYGIASCFPNISIFYSGVLITNLIRFASSTLSGVWFYETTWEASMAYQAAYMIPTTILGLILVPILMKVFEPFFARFKK